VEPRLTPAHQRGHSQQVKAFLSASHATLGQSSGQQFELSIGRVPLRLHVSDAKTFSEVSARYQGFATGQKEQFAVYLKDAFSMNARNPEFTYDFEAQQAAIRAFSRES